MNNTSGKFTKVEGYISEDERIALQRCVLETSHVTGDALEVGSLCGLSALLILSVLQSGKTLLCIEQNPVEILSENLIKYGYGENAAIINEDFKTAAIRNDAKFSFVFIDHDHTYENNVAAFNKFWPLLSPGGIFAFHDYGHPQYEQGTKAIDDLKKEYQFEIESLIRAGGVFAFQK